MGNRTQGRGCLFLFFFFVTVAGTLWAVRPSSKARQEPTRPLLEVATQEVSRRAYSIRLESYGFVRPKIQSDLVAQVGGQIVAVHVEAREGGLFDRGEVLFSIDPRDYEAEVAIAEAKLVDARRVLAESTARNRQAREDWSRLGEGGEAPPLVLRVPQLRAAEAQVTSAEAELDKAKLALERTNVVAPYAGRVLAKHVDLGQVVSPGTLLAEIYATEAAEVRLPLRNLDLPYVELPEPAAGVAAAEHLEHHRVALSSDLLGPSSWEATLVRTEGAIDETARQLHVIGEIHSPFEVGSPARKPLKIGQYVKAEILGKTLPDAIVIPTASIYQGSFVYLVEDGLLQRQEISIGWQDERDALILAGVESGDELVITTLGQVTSGLRVQALGPNRVDENRVSASHQDGSSRQ